MRIATIGRSIGCPLGRLLARGGHQVVFADSRNLEKLAHAAELAGDQRVAVLFAGDDIDAKQTVASLIEDAGFVPVDAGRLADAHSIEPASVE